MKQIIEKLPNLFDRQEELDTYILKEKGLTHDETITDRLLAYTTELMECAQEWRGFKYWSTDQEPRRFVDRGPVACKACNGTGTTESMDDKCVACDGNGYEIKGASYPLLEEYVDVLHFALSITNYATDFTKLNGAQRLAFVLKFKKIYRTFDLTQRLDVTDMFLNATMSIVDAEHWENYGNLFKVLLLGEQLGLRETDILKEYERKYKINVQRQKDGY